MVAPDGTAKIRGNDAGQLSSPWYSIREALSVALTMASFEGDHRDIMIYLENGAVWDPKHGKLVP
jgi:hypothetical protein